MSKSLQDQLLKAGLANKKQSVRAKKAKNSKEKLQRAGVEVTDEAAALAKQAEEQKLVKDRELNRQKTERAQQLAVVAQIKQLVAMNRITERGHIEFRFPEGNLVKTLLLNERQRVAVVNGQLAVVKTGDNYDLVPRKVAVKIAERDDSCVLVCNDDTGDAPEDDEYADYQVPDDLMW